jgi:hypothetical protein
VSFDTSKQSYDRNTKAFAELKPRGKSVLNEKHGPRTGKFPLKTTAKGFKGAPKEGCFHCGGEHYMSKCPTATDADRERLENKHNIPASSYKGRHR